MRKIYQSAPDVPQALANRAIDIVERHFTAGGVRRAEDLTEENKVHLLRELQRFFQNELPAMRGLDGETYNYPQQRGIVSSVRRWFGRVFRGNTEL